MSGLPFSQKEAARRLHTNATFVSAVKNGKRDFSELLCTRMEEELGISKRWLLSGLGAPFSDPVRAARLLNYAREVRDPETGRVADMVIYDSKGRARPVALKPDPREEHKDGRRSAGSIPVFRDPIACGPTEPGLPSEGHLEVSGLGSGAYYCLAPSQRWRGIDAHGYVLIRYGDPESWTPEEVDGHGLSSRASAIASPLPSYT